MALYGADPLTHHGTSLFLHTVSRLLVELDPHAGEIAEIVWIANESPERGRVTDSHGRPVVPELAERAWQLAEAAEDWPLARMTSPQRGGLIGFTEMGVPWPADPPAEPAPAAVNCLREWADRYGDRKVTVEYSLPGVLQVTSTGQLAGFVLRSDLVRPTRVWAGDPSRPLAQREINGAPAQWAVAMAEGSVWRSWNLT
jgi:hypothetical protein